MVLFYINEVMNIHFGFSYIGLIFLLMLMLPNIIGIYGKNVFLIIATLILGIGHIGIHLNHKKEIK